MDASQILRIPSTACVFELYLDPSEVSEADKIFIEILETYQPSGTKRGNVAVLGRDGWMVEEAYLENRGTIEGKVNFYIECKNRHSHYQGELLAFPIDSSMTAEDIQGATITKLNAAGDAWLFYHDHPATHHDHLLAVDAAVMALFQPVMDAAQHKVAMATNAVVLGQADTKYQALSAFRDETLKAAQTAEKAHHLGHFAQNPATDQGHVHSAVRIALNAAKTAFAASPEKIAQYRLITTEAVSLISRMSAPHTPETRWAKAARIAAEEKAKKDAAAEGAGDGSSGS